MNGNSSYSNSNSFGDEPIVATMPWLFRHTVPGQWPS